MRVIVALTTILAVLGCTSEPAEAPPPPVEATRIPAEQAEVVEQEPEPPAAERDEGEGLFVVGITALYRSASRERRVTENGKNVSNYLATLYRGERVQVVDRGDEFVSVEVSDGTRGYIRSTMVLASPGAPATVNGAAKTFRRPSLVALGKTELEPGTLLFVVETKNEFSEVNFAGTRTAWVLTESIRRDAESIAVSRLLNRVRSLKADEAKDNGTEIESVVKLAKTNYPTSPLLPMIVGEIDPEEGARLQAALLDAAANASTLSFPLHGSTPSLAWSPDSQLLLANSAYEYFGFEKELERDEDELGVFVIDVETGKRTRVWRQQAYHPVWMSRDQIAWGISNYETSEESAGLYVGTFDGNDVAVRRVERAPRAVFNTRPGKSGGVVYFANFWTPEAGWYRYDPREDRVSSVATVGEKEGASWDPPSQHVGDGCVQSVGETRVRVDGEGVYVNDERVAETPSMSFEPQGAACEELENHCGYIQPCLSPDAKRLAIVRAGERRGELRVEVMSL
ncbi:MAG: hypothetical protein AAF658_03700 [Myxococcota bacterium]